MFNSEQRNSRKLIGILGQLELDQHWNRGMATFSVSCEEAQHYLSLYMVKRNVMIWGLSGLIFQPGRTPPGVMRGLINRNTRINGMQWTRCTACGRELFAVSAAHNIQRLSASVLDDLISAVVHELEYCRLVLKLLRKKV